MSPKTLFVLMLFAAAPGAPAYADATEDAINDLKKQIQELDQKVRVLEQQRERESEERRAATKETPRTSVGSSGFTVTSADTNFSFGLHGLLQTDNRTFFNDHGIRGNDSFLLRRARPIFSGTLYHDFDFYFVPDFGGSSVQIFDAYLNYRAKPWLQLRAGKFKAPIGLEQMQSDTATSFNERALPNNLVPNRDIGFQIAGDVVDERINYALGVFNGVANGRNTGNADFEDHREVVGRLILQPFKQSGKPPLEGIGLGVGGSWGTMSSSSAGLSAGYLTDGQQQFFTYTNGVAAKGDHWRLAPQAFYYAGPFSMFGEYIISDQQVSKASASADLQDSAWQISAGWVLTGERASYGGVIPRRPFDPRSGNWGAVQLVARYAELHVGRSAFPLFADPNASASAAQAWAVGLNWYLNKNLRLSASFSRTVFTGGGGPGASAPATVTRQPEEAFFTRLQLMF